MKISELIKRIESEEVIDFDEVIEIKNYLPFEIKYGIAKLMANDICDTREDGELYINPLKQEMTINLLLFRYTNIEKDKDIELKDYDLLVESGVFREIEQVAHRDHQGLVQALETEAKQLVDQSKAVNTPIHKFVKKTISDILDVVVDTYKTKEGKAAIKGIIRDVGSNPELLDTVNNILGSFRLEDIKEELMTRLDTAKELEKEAKKSATKSKTRDSANKEVVK